MRTVAPVSELQALVHEAKRPLGFVPTMGALHAGHAALVRRCRNECATTVVSIFVNPLQFGRGEDLERYPRTPEADQALLQELQCDVLFMPSAREVYPAGRRRRVSAGPLGEILEGAARPGHLDGVATVVATLFDMVEPDRAYFGRKDAQQLAVVEALAREWERPLEIVPCDIVRDPDGLALSSRNAYLKPAEREQALGLSGGLRRAERAWRDGLRDAAELEALASTPGLDYAYARCVDPVGFGAPRPGGPLLLVVAARVAGVHLIDNVRLGESVSD